MVAESRERGTAAVGVPAPTGSAGQVIIGLSGSGATNKSILLVAWGRSAARTWVDPLEVAGFNVVVEDRDDHRAFRWAREGRPAVVVIDCANEPATGRELANVLQATNWGRELSVILTSVAPHDLARTAHRAPHAKAILPAPTSVEHVLDAVGAL